MTRTGKKVLVLIGALLASSCAPQHPKDMQAVELMRDSLQPGVDSESIHDRMFTPENLEIVRRAEQNEPDSLQRVRLTILRRTLTDGILVRHAPDARTIARDAGFSSAREMVEEMDGFTFAATRALAESLLTRTDSLNRVLGDTEEPLPPPELQRYLSPETLLQRAQVAYTLMGGDSATAELTSPGMGGFGRVFESLGDALYTANITERALEFRFMGDRSNRVTFRSLAAGLLSNPAWVRQNLNMPVSDLKTYARFAARRLLYFARRRASYALVQCALDADGEPGPDGSMQRFVDIRNFRGMMLAAQFDAWLRSRYGVNWYENPGACATLREIWSQGGRLNADGLLQKIGAPEIRPDALIRSINELLLLSSR